MKSPFDWLPEHLQFIRAHFGEDMSAFQLGKLFKVPPTEIYRAVKEMNLHRVEKTMIQFCTPFPPAVARQVRKAIWEDGYEPMTLSQYHILYRSLDWHP